MFLISGERKQEYSVFSDTEIPVLASSHVSHVLHNHSNLQLGLVSVSSVWRCFLLHISSEDHRLCQHSEYAQIAGKRGVPHRPNALQRWSVPMTFLLGKISPKTAEICESLTKPLPACWPSGLHRFSRKLDCSHDTSAGCVPPSLAAAPLASPLARACSDPCKKQTPCTKFRQVPLQQDHFHS